MREKSTHKATHKHAHTLTHKLTHSLTVRQSLHSEDTVSVGASTHSPNQISLFKTQTTAVRNTHTHTHTHTPMFLVFWF